MAELKIEQIMETALLAWEGTTAALQSCLDGAVTSREFDTLVLATVNRPVRDLHDELDGDDGIGLHMIGDSLDTRRASAAIYEGRKLALSIHAASAFF